MRRTMRPVRSVGLVLAAWLLATVGCTNPGLAGAPKPRETPSGLPVPRYVSLKFDAVNARSGPGDAVRQPLHESD